MTKTLLALAPLVLPFPALAGGTIWDDVSVPAPATAAKPAPKMTDAALVTKARTFLEDGLVDYPGARLKDVKLVRSVMSAEDARWSYLPAGKPVTAFCGKINTPNYGGGMTGWQHFAVMVEGRDYSPLAVVAPNLNYSPRWG